MLLYLIRHAHAVDALDDASRPLSAKGREQVKQLARFLRASRAFTPAVVWHSPLVRARETAERLAQHLGLSAPLVATAGLAPAANSGVIARRIKSLRASALIVGHEPQLSALATLLVTGADGPPAFVMKKSALLALEPAGARWAVRWLVSPELLA